MKCALIIEGGLRIKNQFNDTEGSEKHFHSLYFSQKKLNNVYVFELFCWNIFKRKYLIKG